MNRPRGEAAPLPTKPTSITRNTTSTAAPTTDNIPVPAQLRRRRAASRRLPALVCGHRDTLDCTLADPPIKVEPGSRQAVLALATRHRFARWEVEELIGDLTAQERLILLGGKA